MSFVLHVYRTSEVRRRKKTRRQNIKKTKQKAESLENKNENQHPVIWNNVL